MKIVISVVISNPDPESDGSPCDAIVFGEDCLGIPLDDFFLDKDSGVLFRGPFLFLLKVWKNRFCSDVNIL